MSTVIYKNKHIYILSVFGFILSIILYREQLFYAYSNVESSECIQAGNACITLKDGWYRDYSIDIVAAYFQNESYDSIGDTVTLKYMESMYKPRLLSSNKSKSILVVYQSDVTTIIDNAKKLNSEVINYDWAETIVTPARLLEIEMDRVVIPKYNLILFPDDIKLLEEVIQIENSISGDSIPINRQ